MTTNNYDNDLRAAVERLADEFDSEVDWSAGRNNYGDNGAWEAAARRVRDLLADHPAPEPLSDDAAMHIDPEPPGVTMRPFTDAEVAALDAQPPSGYAVPAGYHDPLRPGTPVLAWPGSRESSPLVTRTRSEVWSLPSGDRVVMVEGYAGGIALTHVDVLPEPPSGGEVTADELAEMIRYNVWDPHDAGPEDIAAAILAPYVVRGRP